MRIMINCATKWPVVQHTEHMEKFSQEFIKNIRTSMLKTEKKSVDYIVLLDYYKLILI